MPDSQAPEPVCRRLLIVGRVQGVWYRASAKTEAERLGLTGWTRNLRDGSVEAVVAGAPGAIDDFIDWARQGPPKAQVERIEISAADAPPEPGFHVLADA